MDNISEGDKNKLKSAKMKGKTGDKKNVPLLSQNPTVFIVIKFTSPITNTVSDSGSELQCNYNCFIFLYP